MVNYKKLLPDLYYSIKRSLTKDFILSQYPSYHDSMLDSFEIVSIDGKISVYYYKDGTLEIQGKDTNPTFRRIVRNVNGLVSKKDYI
ncbi:MAG: hypothetical protein KGI25_03025 [Thaumarchaeota archaeon]|nr:hypothetical protein [Nitrososphaerota archaeon]